MSGDMSGDEQVRAWKDPDAPGDGTRAHPAGEIDLGGAEGSADGVAGGAVDRPRPVRSFLSLCRVFGSAWPAPLQSVFVTCPAP